MNKKLLTWLDIERIIRKKTNNCTRFPDGIFGVDFYSDSVEITIDRDKKGFLILLLKTWFTDWFNENTCEIALDLGDEFISVDFVEFDGLHNDKKTIKPLWHDVAYVDENEIKDCNNLDLLSVKPFTSAPDIIAFHSFKGGVGRTTLLICYLFKLLEKLRRSNSKPILLIDSDLEAPGITYWFSEKDNRPSVSFLDFMEAVHYSSDKAAVHRFFANELKIRFPKHNGNRNIHSTSFYRRKSVIRHPDFTRTHNSSAQRELELCE